MSVIKEIYEGLNKKTRKYIVYIVVVTLVLHGISFIKSNGNTELTKEDLKLPAYGQDNVSIPVDIHYKNADGVINKFNTVIELVPRVYGQQEAEDIIATAVKELDRVIIAGNSSLYEVHSNLNLVNSIEGMPVDISWYSTDYELIDSAGQVNNDKLEPGESRTVTLFALISCGESSKECAYEVTVISKDMSEEEIMVADINRYVEQSVLGSSDYAKLPDEYKGGKLSYYKASKRCEITFLMLGLGAIAVVLLGDSKQKKRVIEEREKQLSFDYSEMVSKLMLLMGAGMTMQRAWEKVVLDYKSQSGKSNKRYVYEEMIESYNQMKAGISEAKIYEDFGKRCGIKEYQKFSTLVVQNLKKGTKDLTQLLELEVVEAFEKRKNLARIKGEEAGTKLLIPMVIMLVVVMIVIMVPSMMKFEM